MNEPSFDPEKLLRKAPRMPVPHDLLPRLQAGISLPPQTSPFDSWNLITLLRNRWRPALGWSLAMVAGLIVLTVQSSTISMLTRENDALRALVEPDNTTDAPASSPSQELERLRMENAELQQLRSEIAFLEQELLDFEILRAENQKLMAQLGAAGGAQNDAFAAASERANSIRCVNNLKNIGLAARIWATENGDVFPPDFLTMQNEIGVPAVLVCPSDPVRSPAIADRWNAVGSDNISYEMVSKGMKDDGPATVVFVKCPFHGHVCLGDGSVMMGDHIQKSGGVMAFKDGYLRLTMPK